MNDPNVLYPLLNRQHDERERQSCEEKGRVLDSNKDGYQQGDLI